VEPQFGRGLIDRNWLLHGKGYLADSAAALPQFAPFELMARLAWV